jgi:hypothetical protein
MLLALAINILLNFAMELVAAQHSWLLVRMPKSNYSAAFHVWLTLVLDSQ